MGSLFQGDPQTSSTSTVSSTNIPTWMQDAIYNQIQWAGNVANTPYQQYQQPLVAGLSPLQKQAFQQTQQSQGAWQPALKTAESGIQNLANTSSVGNIQSYMNPYTQNVTDQIAKLGARNLTENLLPGVSDAFIRAGSFGGTRMGEFGERALRDTQEAILGQQSNALQSGYTQALGAAGSDLTRQQGALSQLAQMIQQGQTMGAADTSALEAAGKAQQGQTQNELTSAFQQWQAQQQYPKQQIDWLSTQLQGMSPIVPKSTETATSSTGQTYSASPLSQIAAAISAGVGLDKLMNQP